MAVSANELRIGNLIQVGGNTIDTYQTYKPIDVTAELIKAIQEENEERGNDYILSVWQPIVLTPEILEKAGFVKAIDNQNNECYELKMSNGIDSYGLYLYENSVGLFHKGALIGGGNIYLHQLQNLYYFLVGEELMVSFT